MSATNRGSKRIKSDFYITPRYTIDTLLNNYNLNRTGYILEPCAGNGTIIKALREFGYKNHIIANEIRVEEYDNLKNSGANEIYISDYLTTFFYEDITTIITNPPFSIAREFLEVSFERYPKAEVIMLLRVGFLETKKRYDFWQKHDVNRLLVLRDRPKFINNGSDATAYAWFVFNKEKNQRIQVIA